MALTFPTTYSTGTQYLSWTWNGSFWETQAAAGYTGSAGVGYTGSIGITPFGGLITSAMGWNLL